MRHSLSLGLVTGLVSALAACGGDGDDDPYDLTYDCDAETRQEEFVAGMSKPGESQVLEFKLLSSDPAPPVSGSNVWMLQLNAMAAPNDPIDGATVRVEPYMPDHKHPAGEPTEVTPDSAPGTYRLDPVDLWMPGLWETTIRVSGSVTDQVVFRFCLPS